MEGALGPPNRLGDRGVARRQLFATVLVCINRKVCTEYIRVKGAS